MIPKQSSKILCKVCGSEKVLRKSGQCCLQCDRLKQARWRKGNKDRYTENQKRWRTENHDAIKKARLRCYYKNRDKYLAYNSNSEARKKKAKIYYKTNEAILREKIQIYSKRNRAKLNLKARMRLKSDPVRKICAAIRTRVRNVIKSISTGRKKTLIKYLGCSKEELKLHLEKQFRDGMTWENHGRVWHLDHIIPLSRAKTTDAVYKLSHYSNFQPLLVQENLRKGAK